MLLWAVPSHVSHLLFATLVLDDSTRSPEDCDVLLLLGAQGPDVFYHNRRTRPSGIRYGTLMHRKDYGVAIAAMCDLARARAFDADSAECRYIRAFASHATLDRYAHPFINYFSGWREPGKPETRRYVRCHTFAERLMDTVLSLRYYEMHPRDFVFSRALEGQPECPPFVVDTLQKALRHSYRSSKNDEAIAERIRNAYRDTRGFYAFMDELTESRMAEYLSGSTEKETRGLLSIVHPAFVDEELDFFNDEHRLWQDPCTGTESSDSLWNLWDKALARARYIDQAIITFIESKETRSEEIAELVGNSHLSSTAPGDCRLHGMAPRDLPGYMDRLAKYYRGLS